MFGREAAPGTICSFSTKKSSQLKFSFLLQQNNYPYHLGRQLECDMLKCLFQGLKLAKIVPKKLLSFTQKPWFTPEFNAPRLSRFRNCYQGSGSGYFSIASASTASASTIKKQLLILANLSFTTVKK